MSANLWQSARRGIRSEDGPSNAYNIIELAGFDVREMRTYQTSSPRHLQSIQRTLQSAQQTAYFEPMKQVELYEVAQHGQALFSSIIAEATT